jgi:raffinose/stachyose/melibiose transport system permease protein
MMLKRISRSRHFAAYALVLPAVLVYTIFSVYPLIDVFGLSFQKWNGLTDTKEYVGFANYLGIFTNDPVFWVAFKNTIIWTVISVLIPPALGFLLALSLNQNIPGKTPLRAMFYLPVIIAPIAVATMWRWMYDPFFGLFNSILWPDSRWCYFSPDYKMSRRPWSKRPELMVPRGWVFSDMSLCPLWRRQ